MSALTTYRNERVYGFCPGCSHRLILDALDRVLVRLQWDPANVVIVSDIGCVGLSDQYFITSGFHGLHGRSLTYATGIKLARPDLHVINLIGDGGCGIGCAHLVSAARRNIGVATLVFNNLNFGMTGGEHSVTTPLDQMTATTPWGNTEQPLNIAQTVAVNGASYIWRGTVFDADLDRQIEAALTHDGFALLDIWELCVAYYAVANRVSPQELTALIDRLGFARGVIQQTSRKEGAAALHEAWAAWSGAEREQASALDVQSLPNREELFSAVRGATAVRGARSLGVIIAGSAGSHVRTAGRLVAAAATLSDLWTAQRDDYPVTVRSGYSVSEVLVSSDPISYTAIDRADVLFVLSDEGYEKISDVISRMAGDGWVFVVPDLIPRVAAQVGSSQIRIRALRLEALKGVSHSSRTLAAVAAGLVSVGWLDPQALIAAAGSLSASYAQANQKAVRSALDAMGDIITEIS